MSTIAIAIFSSDDCPLFGEKLQLVAEIMNAAEHVGYTKAEANLVARAVTGENAKYVSDERPELVKETAHFSTPEVR